MGQALYRKYRTRSLQETIGQEHITTTLGNALKQGRISHAYLFTGPRGVGKTSIARILAHEINGLEYRDDSPHIDIIEIDAASNRRIDEIRELRDKVYVAPVSAKYKVYIIDEVHMLTREAFNALLKTLEEPPEHAVFILATTDAHKLPDTIISRTQRFTFKPVEPSKVSARLAEIAQKEKIKISQEALDMLAEHGEGSFRDSISLLDQLGSHGKEVGAEDVRLMLGIPPTGAIDALLGATAGKGSVDSVVSSLDALIVSGYQPAGIAKQIGRALRSQLISGTTDLAPETALKLLERLIEVPAAHDPERFLEIALLEARPHTRSATPKSEPRAKDAGSSTAGPAPARSADAPAANDDNGENPPAADPPAQSEETEEESKQEGEPSDQATQSTGPVGDSRFYASLWPEVLQTLKRSHNTLYGVVRMAQPEFDGDTLKLTFAFAFHQKRIQESGNRQKLADVIHKLTGRPIRIECLVDASVKPSEASSVTQDPAVSVDLDAISNIFGAAEVLES